MQKKYTIKQTQTTYWNAELNSIVSVDFLGNPPYGRVLKKLVALPLQTKSTL